VHTKLKGKDKSNKNIGRGCVIKTSRMQYELLIGSCFYWKSKVLLSQQKIFCTSRA